MTTTGLWISIGACTVEVGSGAAMGVVKGEKRGHCYISWEGEVGGWLFTHCI